MAQSRTRGRAKEELPAWLGELAPYERPDRRRAVWQMANTFVPYLLLWAVMVRLMHLGVSYWIVLALCVPTAGLLARIFIFFHDCGHGSFFASRRANTVLGYVTGILTLTPYEAWRYRHSIHHASAGDLDRRGVGDIATMTVEEYRAASRWKKLSYRLVRNPLILLGLGPVLVFVFANRWPGGDLKPRHRLSIHITNAALVAIGLAAALTIGLDTYLLIQMPLTILSGAAGVWLFYVQHQFQGVYWARHEQWSPVRAAMEGSSYYRLPRVLQWFTGNIGLHHIHHLRARIPNYHLQRCYDNVPAVQAVKPLTLWASFKCAGYRLYDEERKQLVGFAALRARA